MGKQSVWKSYDQKALKEVNAVCERYKTCLDAGKTERECVALAVEMAKEAGYKDLNAYIAEDKQLKTGDKVYAVWMHKMVALFQIGEEPISNGMNILGAHIDSPRLDVKQNPLYEADGFAYLDTHYYGGIKKYQWVAQPLALHGVAVLKSGKTVPICVGEKEGDPVFTITDILIHLAGEKMEKTAAKVIEGENMDLLIGNMPLRDCKDLKEEEKELVKANILSILKQEYGIEEDDFQSAELEIVPAGKARDLGFDRSMILGYGQDDRICAFTSLFAMLEAENLKKTGVCLLVDKEEIGSVGATGMQSHFFENTVAELIALTEGESELKVRRALARSRMLSSDVSAAYDPLYAEHYEKRNSGFFGRGISMNKFTGVRGKSGSNDANAEYIAVLRKIFDDANVAYQFDELGKVDAGGGGTIAYIMANYGMEVIDSGIALLCMHAPYEVSSKADIYEAVKGYRAFLANA